MSVLSVVPVHGAPMQDMSQIEVVDAMWKDVDFKAKQLGVSAFSFNYVIYNNLLIYRIVIKFIGYSDQCPKQKHSKPCRRVPSSSFRV